MTFAIATCRQPETWIFLNAGDTSRMLDEGQPMKAQLRVSLLRWSCAVSEGLHGRPATHHTEQAKDEDLERPRPAGVLCYVGYYGATLGRMESMMQAKQVTDLARKHKPGSNQPFEQKSRGFRLSGKSFTATLLRITPQPSCKRFMGT